MNLCLSSLVLGKNEEFIKYTLDFYLEVQAQGVKIQNKSKYLNSFLLEKLALKFFDFNFLSEAIVLLQFSQQSRKRSYLEDIFKKFHHSVFNREFVDYLIDKDFIEDLIKFNFKFWQDKKLE